MATSGTKGQTIFETQKVIDHAFRRCKLVPQQITSEHIETALEILFLILSTWSSTVLNLWAIKRTVLPLYPNAQSVPTPKGTVDVLNCNLRTSQRLIGTAFATEGTAAQAFDADRASSCTQTAAAGSITLDLGSGGSSTSPIFGLLPNAGGTWGFNFQYSDEGTIYTDLLVNLGITVVAGEWLWYEVEGVEAHRYYRLLGTGTTVLDVRELVFQTLPQEIPLWALNRDDYSNLPNKTRPGRPTQYWYDKARSQPLITVWPNVELQFTFAQLVCYIHRHIEDVGSMTQEIELPDRWYLAIVTALAAELSQEIKEVDLNLIPILVAKADVEFRRAGDGETDNSTSFFRPNIRAYTS